jgi:hypothetical protein
MAVEFCIKSLQVLQILRVSGFSQSIRHVSTSETTANGAMAIASSLDSAVLE